MLEPQPFCGRGLNLQKILGATVCCQGLKASQFSVQNSTTCKQKKGKKGTGYVFAINI